MYMGALKQANVTFRCFLGPIQPPPEAQPRKLACATKREREKSLALYKALLNETRERIGELLVTEWQPRLKARYQLFEDFFEDDIRARTAAGTTYRGAAA
ncbi:hypothetical protein DFH11DRAFT_1730884 [Phellopilus nigrolimitatus]|nr:hypothetical protein DFH11DRAFT_1730884 [Phellopilus nigrolimitatus]